MNTLFWFELVGYLASALIVISFMMRSIVRLRVVNLAGAGVFALYGFLISAYPVAAVNTLIVAINIFHLHKMFTAKEYFRLLKLRPDSDFLRYFLTFYRHEIRRVVPDFSYVPSEKQVTLLILRDCIPAGAFIGDEIKPGVLHVRLDFVIPQYRDLKIGHFLFSEQAKFFREKGIFEIVIEPRSSEFRSYLGQMGFVEETDGTFRLKLGEH